MKISFLTIYTPTPENFKGPSALPYYLLLHRDKDISVVVYSFNLNEIPDNQIKDIEEKLNLKIKIYPLPKCFRFLKNFKLTSLRVFLKYPLNCYVQPNKKMLKEIENDQPDIVWQYPDYFVGVVNKLSQFKHVITGPDCPALVYFRQLKDSTGYKSFTFWMGLAKVAYSAIQLTKADARDNVRYHLVGMNDWREEIKIVPEKNVFFLLHPHFEIKQNPIINFSSPKLKLLIAGKLDFYMQSGVDEMIPVLCNMKEDIKKHYEITFLGKGWDDVCTQLNNAEIEAHHVKWVDNYIDGISKYDIQLTPITVGGGTKGKVLDAFANGLLVIGTEVALENIAVRNMDSCIYYKNPIQLPGILESIMYHREKYEAIARKGMNQVRVYHAPKRIAKRFFDIIKQ